MDFSGSIRKERMAVVIPAYNHEDALAGVIKEALKLNLPVIVVDDGSTDATAHRLNSIRDIYLLRHSRNRGKGAALMTGFAEAAKIADWAITMDADGQHLPEDARNLVRAIPQNERPIMVGLRQGMANEHVPWTSRFGRKFSNFWVWLSGGPKMMDSQSGFRIYPLPEAMNLNVAARRFQFEVEILVKAARKNMRVVEVPVRVNYAPATGRVSHFRPFVDFMRNGSTFARLIVQRILNADFLL